MPRNENVPRHPDSETMCLVFLPEMMRPITRRALLATERAPELRTSERMRLIVARPSGRPLLLVLARPHPLYLASPGGPVAEGGRRRATSNDITRTPL